MSLSSRPSSSICRQFEHPVTLVDEFNTPRHVEVPGESPLTLYVDKREIVMKTAHMGIAVLLSRPGVTHMGLELAQEPGVTMIARANRSPEQYDEGGRDRQYALH